MSREWIPFISILLFCAGCSLPRNSLALRVQETGPLVATFSIVALDPVTGDLGVAVQSKFFGVGSVVPWARANVGAVATQSYANVRYGPEGLALFERNQSAEETLKTLLAADPLRERRQVGIMAADGKGAAFTGAECHDWAGHRVGSNYCVQGNLLAGEEVISAMAAAFESARGESVNELADCLMAALRAGQQAGGDKRGQQSAALLVVRENGGLAGANDRFIDLRVEDHPAPIEELARLLEIHKRFFAGARKKTPTRKMPASAAP